MQVKTWSLELAAIKMDPMKKLGPADLHGGLGDAAPNNEQMRHLLWGRALARYILNLDGDLLCIAIYCRICFARCSSIITMHP